MHREGGQVPENRNMKEGMMTRDNYCYCMHQPSMYKDKVQKSVSLSMYNVGHEYMFFILQTWRTFKKR